MAWYMAALLVWGLLFLPPADDRLAIAAAVIPTGILLDYLLHRWQTGRPNLQSSLITATIVTLLMPSDVSLGIAVLAVVTAVGSKHFLLWRKKHIFNPAAFGVTVTAVVFGYALGWWPDSYTDYNGYFLLAVVLGISNLWRVRKFWQAASFAAGYLVLVYGLGAQQVPDLTYQTLPVLLPWFFLFFMLPEPVTSLQPRRQQITFGFITAVVAFGLSYVGTVSAVSLLLGLLVANAYAAAVRHQARAKALA